MATLTKKDTPRLLQAYRQMVTIREFENNANDLYLGAKMPGQSRASDQLAVRPYVQKRVSSSL